MTDEAAAADEAAKRARRERERLRSAARRRAAGAPTRAQFLASSREAARPWSFLGTSRATFYRRLAQERSAAQG